MPTIPEQLDAVKAAYTSEVATLTTRATTAESALAGARADADKARGELATALSHVDELTTQFKTALADKLNLASQLTEANSEIARLKAKYEPPIVVGPSWDATITPTVPAIIKPGMRVKVNGDWSGKTFVPVAGESGKIVTYDFTGAKFDGKGTTAQAIDCRIEKSGKVSYIQYISIENLTAFEYAGGGQVHLACVRVGPNAQILNLKMTKWSGIALGVNDGDAFVGKNLTLTDGYGVPLNISSGTAPLIDGFLFARNNQGHKRQVGLNNVGAWPDGLGRFKNTYESIKENRTVNGVVRNGQSIDNWHQGWWCDVANIATLVENCIFSGNRGVGLRSTAENLSFEYIPELKSGTTGTTPWEGAGTLLELQLGAIVQNCKFYGNSGNGLVLGEANDTKGGTQATIVRGCEFTSLPAWNKGDNNGLALRDGGNRVIKGYKADGSDQPMKLYGVLIDSCTFKNGAQVRRAGDGWGADTLAQRNVTLKNNTGLN
jgi:hypothetical protein